MENVKGLLEFIKQSPSQFHVIHNIKELLNEHGYTELHEEENWKVVPGKQYYVIRNNSSIIAFNLGNDLSDYSFNVVASHSDSPTFKLKENYEINVNNEYTKLNTEGYGGMICSTWFDKPLSIAGRILVKEGNSYKTKLVNIDKDLLMIPSVAIHMNREVNEGYKFNKQIDLLPLVGGSDYKENDLLNLIANSTNSKTENILGLDLFLYNRQDYSIWGMNDEYISSRCLDDLECAYTSLIAFLNASNNQSINVCAVFDNEEVGSGTKQGAVSTLLYDALSRLNDALGKSKEDYHKAIASSFLLSSDNAHAVHPNHTELTDATNNTYMNKGVVVKSHASQKYCSDAISVGILKGIAQEVNVPLQYFSNRSDKAGGSTLGNLAMSQVSMNAVDIGLPQLAMHSSYETAGVKDVDYMITLLKAFYSHHIHQNGAGNYTID